MEVERKSKSCDDVKKDTNVYCGADAGEGTGAARCCVHVGPFCSDTYIYSIFQIKVSPTTAPQHSLSTWPGQDVHTRVSAREQDSTLWCGK